METSLTSLHDCHSDKVYLMGNGHAPVCLFEPEIESAKTVYAASAGNRHRPYPEVSVISCSNEQLATGNKNQHEIVAQVNFSGSKYLSQNFGNF